MNETYITIPLAPVSKKNHQQIIRVGGRPRIIQSKQYRQYETEAIKCIEWNGQPISCPSNVEMIFYMPTRRRVDLVNLQEAALDVLVRAGVLEDDNCKIVTTMDGSRVSYDKRNPRTEIRITEGGEI